MYWQIGDCLTQWISFCDEVLDLMERLVQQIVHKISNSQIKEENNCYSNQVDKNILDNPLIRLQTETDNPML